ncbi:hypothetical protein GALMADRAFT_745273 [Galerina marginata CBS 339.88]|uniref:Uncharacterized protein n=1 Tax=Galerina marginata (strain CBS 339.88) TaxID=685588 RepID=A0A067SQ61_GALM3|nr:hypothetical protein GALMADRAFT_745273 [Galerina marginata CBS 339.88]
MVNVDETAGGGAPANNPLSPTSISSFLVYMQRRLSDIVASDSRSTTGSPRREELERGDSPNTSAIADGANEHGSINADPSNYHLTESPSLHRAGLLQPKSYNVPSTLMPSSSHQDSHTPDSIRAATLQLSNMPFPSSVATGGGGTMHSLGSFSANADATTPTAERTHENTTSDFIFPQSTAPRSSSISLLSLDVEPDQASLGSQSHNSLASSFLRDMPSSPTSPSGSGLDSSILTLPPPPSSDGSDDQNRDHDHQHQQGRTSPERHKPSGISLLRPASSGNTSRSSSISSRRSGEANDAIRVQEETPSAQTRIIADTTPTATPMGTPRPLQPGPLPSMVRPSAIPTPNRVHWRSPNSLARPLGPSPTQLYSTPLSPLVPSFDETTPLLHDHYEANGRSPPSELQVPKPGFLNGHSHGYGGSGQADPNSEGLEAGWGARTFFQGSGKSWDVGNLLGLKSHFSKELAKAPEHAMVAVKAVPAVLLGCLLNILDGVSSFLSHSRDEYRCTNRRGQPSSHHRNNSRRLRSQFHTYRPRLLPPRRSEVGSSSGFLPTSYSCWVHRRCWRVSH